MLLFDALPDGVDGSEQLVLVDGLGQIVFHAVADRSLRVGEVGVAAQDDEPAVVALLARDADDVDAGELGHADIQKDETGVVF